MRPEPGRTALVTGASRGLGVAIAQALAAKGCDLILTARSRAGLEVAAEKARSAGAGRVSIIVCDLSDPASITDLAHQAESSGTVDFLINNAGAERATAYVARTASSILDDIALNLTAPMLLTHALLPGMIARRSGHVVNVASASGLIATPYQEPYSATKFGMVGFSRSLRLTSRMEGWGVGISAVCPGFIADDGMFARIAQERGLDPQVYAAAPLAAVGQAVCDAIAQNVELACIGGGDTLAAVGFSYADPAAFADLMEREPAAKLFQSLARGQFETPARTVDSVEYERIQPIQDD